MAKKTKLTRGLFSTGCYPCFIDTMPPLTAAFELLSENIIFCLPASINEKTLTAALTRLN